MTKAAIEKEISRRREEKRVLREEEKEWRQRDLEILQDWKIMHRTLLGYHLSFAYQTMSRKEEQSISVTFTYTICSKADQFSKPRARRILASHINRQSFLSTVILPTNRAIGSQIGRQFLLECVNLPNPTIPRNLVKQVKKYMENGEMSWLLKS